MSQCKACGIQLTWIMMKSGRAMPCNPGLVWYRAAEGGPAKIVTPDGMVLSAEITDKEHADGMGYISHYATCPGAERFRRR